MFRKIFGKKSAIGPTSDLQEIGKNSALIKTEICCYGFNIKKQDQNGADPARLALAPTILQSNINLRVKDY